MAELYLLFERSKGKRSFFLIFRSPGKAKAHLRFRNLTGTLIAGHMLTARQSECAHYLFAKEETI